MNAPSPGPCRGGIAHPTEPPLGLMHRLTKAFLAHPSTNQAPGPCCGGTADLTKPLLGLTHRLTKAFLSHPSTNQA